MKESIICTNVNEKHSDLAFKILKYIIIQWSILTLYPPPQKKEHQEKKKNKNCALKILMTVLHLQSNYIHFTWVEQTRTKIKGKDIIITRVACLLNVYISYTLKN